MFVYFNCISSVCILLNLDPRVSLGLYCVAEPDRANISLVQRHHTFPKKVAEKDHKAAIELSHILCAKPIPYYDRIT